MVAELVATIKPKRLKVDQIRLNILNALRAEGRIIKRELEKTTTTWKGEKPKFDIAIGLDSRDAILLVGPAGSQKGAEKWIWLDEGTKPHPIRAKNAPNLIFRHGSGFRPKTKVQTFASFPGANKGPWVSKKRVIHPGIKARKWSETIQRKRRNPFVKRIARAARFQGL
jgi:hypothetical protein